MKMMMRIAAVASTAVILVACGSGEGDATAKSEAPKSHTPARAQPSAAPTAKMPKHFVAKDKNFNPCILTPQEITSVAGWKSSPGKADQSGWEAYGIADCKYEETGGLASFVVNMTWVDPQYLEQTKASMHKFDADSMEKIPGDADEAFVQYQDGMNTGALHYVRSNIMVEIRPMDWKGSHAELKAKLLALRRIP